MPAKTTQSPSHVTDTVTEDKPATLWQVVVFDDPINLMSYVVLVLVRVLSLDKATAERHMLEVHQKGESIVWGGEKEKAEAFVQAILGWKLNAQLRPS